MSEKAPSIGIFLVRITLGICFLLHGLQKAFGVMGGPGPGGFAKYLEGIGAYAPTMSAYAIAYGELFCGVTMLVGFLHKISAVVILIIMAGAILYVHGQNGYFAQEKGYEYVLALISMALLVLMAGPGVLAYKFEFKKNKAKS